MSENLSNYGAEITVTNLLANSLIFEILPNVFTAPFVQLFFDLFSHLLFINNNNMYNKELIGSMQQAIQ